MTNLWRMLVEWVRIRPELALALTALGWLAAITLLYWVLRFARKRDREVLRKAGRWLSDHLVQVLSWLAVPVLVFALFLDYFESGGTLRDHQLVLLGLILIAAVLAQFANELLPLLKKVGPVEFVEQRFDRIELELEGLSEIPDLPSESDQPLSKELLLEYQKADQYVTHLEWSGLEEKTAKDAKFHYLIFKMSAVALHQGDWVRAADRLELLLKVSGGEFKTAETHYRCGIAYRFWAESTRGPDREKLFKQAQKHFWKATKRDPYYWSAYFNLAYVQVDLRMYEKARQNNLKVLELRPDYAPARYNLTICYIKLSKLGDSDKNLDEALEHLVNIKREDQDAERTIAKARKDEELRDLLRDGVRGSKAVEFLASFEASPETPKPA